MSSDKIFDEAPVKTVSTIRFTASGNPRNPAIARSGENAQGENGNGEVLSSTTTELLRLAIKNGIGQNSRIMAWDNQRIFGPALERRSSLGNGDLEAE